MTVRLALFAASLACAALSGFAMTLAVSESPTAGATRTGPSPAAIERLMDSMRPALPASVPPAPSPRPVLAPAATPRPPPAAAAPPIRPAIAPTPVARPTPVPPLSKAAPPATSTGPGLRSGADPSMREDPPAPSAAGASLVMPADGAFVAQVGAFPTVALAQESWSVLAAAHPALAGLSPQLNPVTLNGRIIYRSQVAGFASRAGASSFCRTLRAAGSDCFVPNESDSPASNPSNR